MEKNQNSVTQFGGLNTDTSLVAQPLGTTRFVLNGVNESLEGDSGFISTENGNKICFELPLGYIPIGKVYIGNGKTFHFLTNPNGNSITGISDEYCNFKIVHNDSEQVEKFGFKVTQQIDAIFRLRRGCETTVYWVDPKPRISVVEKPEKYKNSIGEWEMSKFELFKKYQKIPEVKNIEVLDTGGNTLQGSYNVAVRYLDEDLNPSEWISSFPTVNIYNKSQTESFLNIQGSINSELENLQFGTTTKAIKVELDNLDENYPFYQLAFIEATAGTGQISSVKVSQEIDINNRFFVYTGTNYAYTTTLQEIVIFNSVIDKAGSIEQIENRLIIGDTKGKNIDFCKLQKYASRITSDMITQTVVTNSITDKRNTKNPILNYGNIDNGGVGYMPGEIYSYGIVYVFEDKTVTPTYHIPGKNPNVAAQRVFNPGANTFSMSKNNTSATTRYTDRNSCNTGDYWGVDSEGLPLRNSLVRHHRFPLRSEVSLPLVESATGGTNVITYFNLRINVAGNLVVAEPSFGIEVTYTVAGGFEESFTSNVNPAIENATFNLNLLSSNYLSNQIVVTSIKEIAQNGVTNTITPGVVSPKGLIYASSVVQSQNISENKVHTTKILGIKFSNIDLPSLLDTNGEKIVGYYIVRNERLEEDKTILDTGVLIPLIKNGLYSATGLLNPEIDNSKIDKKIFGLIHPEHKFNNKEYTNVSSIKQEGNFIVTQTNKSKISYNDVVEGTGFNSGIHKEGNDDGGPGEEEAQILDGWSIKIIVRDNILSYVKKTIFNLLTVNIKEIFYLKAVESKQINNEVNTVYNTATDNRIGIVHTHTEIINTVSDKLPYVVLQRNLLDNYPNFRTLPYYKESVNMEKFNTVTNKGVATIFNGDTYVCPMRYVNTVFWNNTIADRKKKDNGFLGDFAKPLIFVAAAALIVLGFVSGGTTAIAGLALLTWKAVIVAAGITALGFATSVTISGIERANLSKAYDDAYDKGLRETTLDTWVNQQYRYGNQAGQCTDCPTNTSGFNGPTDDEIQWIGDCLTDLWFESSVNISLRNKMSDSSPTFLDAPGIIETGNMSLEIPREFFNKHYWRSTNRFPISKLENHMANKLLVFDSKKKANKTYVGFGLGEYYNVNPDYHRKNKEKIYNHLALEYDCCSDCTESFPHRFQWSEQSFQEELTDNYRTFLPNNYKDLEGDTGKITDIFKIQNNLYIHTEEALWHLPQSVQERVTGDIISFIGTGEYFSIPPRKIVDDVNSSAGNTHKWARLKTKHGVLFPSHREGKWYLFTGGKLNPISDMGMTAHFRQAMEFKIEQEYYKNHSTKYPFSNNPSNPIGTGYISVYDSINERLIVTKRDLQITNLPLSDYKFYTDGGQVTIFRNISVTINARAILGWNYLGIENSKLKFQKIITTSTTETVNVTTCVPNICVQPPCPEIFEKIFTYTANLDTENPQNTIIGWTGLNLKTGLLDEGIGYQGFASVQGCYEGISFQNSAGNGGVETMEVTLIPCNILCPQVTDCGEVCTTVAEVRTTSKLTTIEEYVGGEVIVLNTVNNSWTMSYSLKTQQWTSWHSYLPNNYFQIQGKFYSWINGNRNVWEHNVENLYLSFYGVAQPYIVEYVDAQNPISTQITEAIKFQTEAKRFNTNSQEYFDVVDVTFNKLIAYNTHQITGILNMLVKSSINANYLSQQIIAIPNQILLDRVERDWNINQLRNIRVGTLPMFVKTVSLLPNNYIDKVVNPLAVNPNLPWFEMESLRDKFIVVRLIFDTRTDTKLIMNFTIQDKKVSER